MKIVDITTPASPTLLSTLTTEGNSIIRDIQTDGNYAYAANDTKGLLVVDVTDLAAPFIKNTYDTAGKSSGIALDANYVYLGDNGNGLLIFNRNNITNGSVAPNIIQSFTNAVGVHINGNYGYVTDTTSNAFRIIALDLTSPKNPTILSFYKTQKTPNDIYVSGGYAYIAEQTQGLTILDISTPTHPTFVGQYNTPGNAGGVRVAGNYAYVADGNQFTVVDIIDKSAPTLAGNCLLTGMNTSSITLDGQVAFLAVGGQGVRIIDIANPNTPTLIGSYQAPTQNAWEIYVSGDYAFVAYDDLGLIVLDISDPTDPTLVSSFETDGKAKGITGSGNIIYIADDTNGLVIFDLTNPATPQLIGHYDTPKNANRVALKDHYAVVANKTGAISVIDIYNPYLPIQGLSNPPPTITAIAGAIYNFSLPPLLNTYTGISYHLGSGPNKGSLVSCMDHSESAGPLDLSCSYISNYGATGTDRLELSPAHYGDPFLPATPGGGSSSNSGGGVIQLTVAGILTLNGKITSRGGNTVATYPGAGGSIYINAGTLKTTAGTPLIEASQGSEIGKSSGGRIAIYYDILDNFVISSTSVQAFGGTAGDPDDIEAKGGVGSIYYKATDETYGHMLFDNNGSVSEQPTVINPNYTNLTLSSLKISNKARVTQGSSNYNLVVQNLTLETGGTLYIPDNHDGDVNTYGSSTGGTFSGNVDWFSNTLTGTGINPGTNLIEDDALGGYYSFTINSANVGSYSGANWVILGGQQIIIELNSNISINALDLQTGGVLTHAPCSVNQCYRIDLTIATNATIADNAIINVDAKGLLGGYRGDNNTERGGIGLNNYIDGPNSWNNGGVHGGTQGRIDTFKGYGNIKQPITHGGGTSAGTNALGGNGGGVVHLNVTGTLTINGTISAMGEIAHRYYSDWYRPSSAGGSIWLESNIIANTAGTPLIKANGGGGNTKNCGVGSGGRVAIYYDSLSSFVISSTTVQAFSGVSTATAQWLFEGAAGTVFYQATTDVNGHLIYHNNNRIPTYESLMLPADHAALTLDTMSIDGYAKITQNSDSPIITVGIATVQSGSTCKVQDNADTGYGAWFNVTTVNGTGSITEF